MAIMHLALAHARHLSRRRSPAWPFVPCIRLSIVRSTKTLSRGNADCPSSTLSRPFPTDIAAVSGLDLEQLAAIDITTGLISGAINSSVLSV
jgi:hypothetical protein